MPFPEAIEAMERERERLRKQAARDNAFSDSVAHLPTEEIERRAKKEREKQEAQAYQERLVAWAHRRPAFVCSPENAQILCDAAFAFLEASGRGDQQPTDFDLDAAFDAHGPAGSNRLEIRREHYTGRLTPDSHTLTREQLREASLGRDPRDWTL